MKRWIWIGVLSLTVPMAEPVLAQAPPILPLQGFLTDLEGAPIDGPLRMTFTLYDAEEDGNTLFVDDYRSFEVVDGQFSVYLGSQDGHPLDLAVFDSSSVAWLEIVLDGREIVTPRIQIGSVAYAAVANRCGDASTLEGMSASAFAPADHTHPPVVAAATAATLQNGWTFYGAPYENPSYRKDSDGVVHLSGLVRDGTDTIFTLPEGMRPAAQHLFPALTYDPSISTYVMGRVDVYPDGNVVAVYAGSSWLSVDGISFVAAQ